MRKLITRCHPEPAKAEGRSAVDRSAADGAYLVHPPGIPRPSSAASQLRRLGMTLVALLLVPLTVSAQDPGRIAAHMRFLASDVLEGRGTATRGHLIAAQYVASEYEKLGLEPGANGSFFQSVPFVKTNATDVSSIVIVHNGVAGPQLKLGADFATVGDPTLDQLDIDAPVVYAGYGITAPPQKYDDYAGLDTKGKVVAMFSGAPASFPSDLRAHFAATLTKMENAAAHGAVGVIFLRAARDEARAAWPRVIRQYELGGMNWTDAKGDPKVSPRSPPA